MVNMLCSVPDFSAITILWDRVFLIGMNGAGLDLQSRVNLAIPGGETGYLPVSFQSSVG